MTAPYRILCFDGGGVRGVLMLAMLIDLDRRVPAWRTGIDLYAGTSTGGLIALGLAAGWSPDRLLSAYRGLAPDVFADHWSDDLRDLGCALGAEYDGDGLKKAAEELLGDLRLDQLAGRVLVPTFRLGTRPRAKFYHNFVGVDSDGATRAVDVARFTTAAPVYFPTADGHIDGGVVANHPGMAAISQTQDRRNRETVRPSISDIRMLSIGGGSDRRPLPEGDNDWGWVRWARPLLGVFVDGGVSVVDYQCRQLLGDRYRRVEPAFADGTGPALDQIDAIARLERLPGTEMAPDMAACAEWIQTEWLRTEWLRAKRLRNDAPTGSD